MPVKKKKKKKKKEREDKKKKNKTTTNNVWKKKRRRSAFLLRRKWNGVTQRKKIIISRYVLKDRVRGLVVRVSGYRSGGPWFNSRRYQIFWEVVGLERGPLNLVWV
jgi:hypothetical protein